MEKSLITEINERHFFSRVTQSIREEVPCSEFLDLYNGTLCLAIHTFDGWKADQGFSLYRIIRSWQDNHPELRDAWNFHVLIYKLIPGSRSQLIKRVEGPIIREN
ncbi:MAG: hypothetical protein HKN79_02560 [Flavobacteriales bacterium]|nr:hypothetical protein [Flavobacteriales bacterium]